MLVTVQRIVAIVRDLRKFGKNWPATKTLKKQGG